MCYGGGWGDRRVMKGRREQVNYDICMSAQQDVVFGDNKEKRDQVHAIGQRRKRDEGDVGQDDKHS